MKQIILRYGLLSGLVAAILMTVTVSIADFENGAWMATRAFCSACYSFILG